MAEIIGLISGLMTVGNAGLVLFETLHNFAKGIRSAEEDIRLVAYEIQCTTAVIDLLKRSLDGLKHTSSDVIEKGLGIIPGLTTQCDYLFNRIEELVSFLKPYHDQSAADNGRGRLVLYNDTTYRRPRFLEKWKWKQQQPSVDRLRRNLEALKSNLALLVAIIELEVAVKRQSPQDFRENLREDVNSALREASACSDELDGEVEATLHAQKSGSMVVLAPQHRTLRPQRAVKNLAREIVLWTNLDEPDCREQQQQQQRPVPRPERISRRTQDSSDLNFGPTERTGNNEERPLRTRASSPGRVELSRALSPDRYEIPLRPRPERFHGSDLEADNDIPKPSRSSKTYHTKTRQFEGARDFQPYPQLSEKAFSWRGSPSHDSRHDREELWDAEALCDYGSRAPSRGTSREYKPDYGWKDPRRCGPGYDRDDDADGPAGRPQIRRLPSAGRGEGLYQSRVPRATTDSGGGIAPRFGGFGGMPQAGGARTSSFNMNGSGGGPSEPIFSDPNDIFTQFAKVPGSGGMPQAGGARTSSFNFTDPNDIFTQFAKESGSDKHGQDEDLYDILSLFSGGHAARPSSTRYQNVEPIDVNETFSSFSRHQKPAAKTPSSTRDQIVEPVEDERFSARRRTVLVNNDRHDRHSIPRYCHEYPEGSLGMHREPIEDEDFSARQRTVLANNDRHDRHPTRGCTSNRWEV